MERPGCFVVFRICSNSGSRSSNFWRMVCALSSYPDFKSANGLFGIGELAILYRWFCMKLQNVFHYNNVYDDMIV